MWAAHSSYRCANPSSQLTRSCSHVRPARCHNDGVKLKGLDLAVPVRDADLTEGERQFARARHDLPIP
jgi:hypothetical protein